MRASVAKSSRCCDNENKEQRATKRKREEKRGSKRNERKLMSESLPSLLHNTGSIQQQYNPQSLLFPLIDMLMQSLYRKAEPKEQMESFQRTIPIHYIPLNDQLHQFPTAIKMGPRNLPPPIPVEKPITFQKLPPIILTRIIRHLQDFESLNNVMLSCRRLYTVAISTPNILLQISNNYFPYRSLQLVGVWRKNAMTQDARRVLRDCVLSRLPQLSFVSQDPRKMNIEDREGDIDLSRESHTIGTAEVLRMKSDLWKAKCMAALGIAAELIIRTVEAECYQQKEEMDSDADVDMDYNLSDYRRNKVESYLSEYRLVMLKLLAHRITPEEFIEYFSKDPRFALRTNLRNNSPASTLATISLPGSPERAVFDYEVGVRTAPASPSRSQIGDSSYLTNEFPASNLNQHYQVVEIMSMEDIIDALFMFMICLREHQENLIPHPRARERYNRRTDGFVRRDRRPLMEAEKLKDNIARFASNKEYQNINRLCDLTNDRKGASDLWEEMLRELLSFALLDTDSVDWSG